MTGIHGGFTAHTSQEASEWTKALEEAVEKVTVQDRFRDNLLDALSICCAAQLVTSEVEIGSKGDEVLTPDVLRVDTLLETEILEIGLAELHDESLPEPDAEFQKVNIHPKAKKWAYSLNFIFRKSPLSLYMLVQTRLVRAAEGTVVDQRQFGYLGHPLQYLEWSEYGASPFRAELMSASRSLTDEIMRTFVLPTPRSSESQEHVAP